MLDSSEFNGAHFSVLVLGFFGGFKMNPYTLTISSLTAFVVLPVAVHGATMIDKFVQIQPIQVCDNNGSNCAGVQLNKSFTETTFAQAGIAPVFLPTKQINDSSLLTVNGVNDVNKAGNGQSSNALTINTWFVDSLNSAPNTTLFGEAYLNGNGVVVNSSAVAAASRTDTFAHEVGHNLGLGHGTSNGANNLMETGSTRSVPASGLTQAQINTMRASQFAQEAPKVTVDLRGATPFDSTDFFDVKFDSGPSGISLTKLTVDLSPVNAFFDVTNASPGNSSSAFGFGSLSGLSNSDISVNGLVDGATSISLSFAAGTFTVGDGISFGNDIDLFSAIDQFGATPQELVGAKFGFEFDIGFSLETALDADLITSSLEVSQFGTVFGTPTPFGPQVPPGQVAAIGTVDPDPVPGTFGTVAPVPLPASFVMLLAAFGFLACNRIAGFRRNETV